MMMKMKSAICVMKKKVMMFQVLTAKVVFLSLDRRNTELLTKTADFSFSAKILGFFNKDKIVVFGIF